MTAKGELHLSYYFASPSILHAIIFLWKNCFRNRSTSITRGVPVNRELLL